VITTLVYCKNSFHRQHFIHCETFTYKLNTLEVPCPQPHTNVTRKMAPRGFFGCCIMGNHS